MSTGQQHMESWYNGYVEGVQARTAHGYHSDVYSGEGPRMS